MPPRRAGGCTGTGIHLFGDLFQRRGERGQLRAGGGTHARTQRVHRIAFLHQCLAQVEIVVALHIGQGGGGQRIQPLGTVHVVGVGQALCGLAQQQFGLFQLQRLRAMAGAVGQLGQVVFQQRVALAQAQHFIAQHAVGGGRVLHPLRGRTLVAAQRFHTVHQALQLQPGIGLRLGGTGLFGLPAGPAPCHAHANHQHDRERHDPAQGTGVRRWRNVVSHAGILVARAGVSTSWRATWCTASPGVRAARKAGSVACSGRCGSDDRRVCGLHQLAW